MAVLKGNAIVGQSGGCTAVINCSLLGVIEAAKKSKAIQNIYGMANGIDGLLQSQWISLSKQPSQMLKLLYNTPSAALGSCRLKINEAQMKQAVQILKRENIRYFYLIGGNDSADTTLKISKAAHAVSYELRVIAIPKTIDNDLPLTDHCPGYGSVARFIAQTTQEAGLDTWSMKGVDPFKVIEVMGRNAGWMVAAAALGKKEAAHAPHLLYFPEFPFEEEKFLSDAEKVYKKHGHAVIVISETIRGKDGKRIAEKKGGVTSDSFGHGYVEGAAETLCRILETHFKKRARFDKPGTIQRMSMPYISPVDQAEAYGLGHYAVTISLEGKSGLMTVLLRENKKKYTVRYGAVKIEAIANTEKKLPLNFVNAEKNFVTQEFIDYALPLLGSPLPDFCRLKGLS